MVTHHRTESTTVRTTGDGVTFGLYSQFELRRTRNERQKALLMTAKIFCFNDSLFLSLKALSFYRLPIKSRSLSVRKACYSLPWKLHSLLSPSLLLQSLTTVQLSLRLTHLNGHEHFAQNVKRSGYVRQRVMYTWTVAVKIFLDDTNERLRAVGL